MGQDVAWASTACACLLALTIFASAPAGSEAAVHKYANETFEPYIDAVVFGGAREGMRATRLNANETNEIMERWVEHPLSGMSKAATDGFSYIRLSDITFYRSPEIASQFADGVHLDSGLVQVLIFEVNNKYKVGHTREETNEHYLCCTEELAKEIYCTPSTLILKPERPDQKWPILLDVHFQGDDTEAIMEDQVVEITKKGLYSLWFISCDPQFSDVRQPLTVTGRTIWKNPTGYLPGMMLPFISLYGMLSLGYLLLGVVWVGLMLRKWRDIIMLQSWISLVIFMSMLEATLWYFDYVNFNNSGFRPAGITIWAVLVGTARKVTSKIVLLVVCMGYGIVRPTLGELSKRVNLLTVAYLIATLLLDIFNNIGQINDMTSFERVLLIFPLAILDAITIIWMFTSLNKICTQLLARKQMIKLNMYRRLYNLLIAAAVLSGGFMTYEMYFRMSDAYNELWESEWMTIGFWQVLSFGLTVAVCFIYAPSQTTARYTYSKLEDIDDADAHQGIALTEEVKSDDKASHLFSLDDDEEAPSKME